jgi:hypothetical protein
MGRTTRAQELGLTQEITEDEEGQYTLTLKDAQGSILFERHGYLNHQSANQGGLHWMRTHYKPTARPRPQAPSSGQTGQLLSIIRTKAQDNESQALRLRAQADLLETEAKKLHAAADVLEGPEAD